MYIVQNLAINNDVIGTVCM